MKKLIKYILLLTCLLITLNVSSQTTNIYNTYNNCDTTQQHYSIYKALLSQSGTTAPTAYELENTIGDIVWIYQGVGVYAAYLDGAFPLARTYLSVTNNMGNIHYIAIYNQENGEPSNIVRVITKNDCIDNDSQANNLLWYTPVEIIVYKP